MPDLTGVLGENAPREVVQTFESFNQDHEPNKVGVLDRNDWRRLAYVYQLVDGRSVLDVGVGNGAFLHILEKSGKFDRIQGIDIRPHSMLRLPDGVGFSTMSVTDMAEFKDDEFDTVLCQEVLEHLEVLQFADALDELRRVTRTRLVVTVPYEEPEPVWWYNKPGGHRQSFSQRKIDRLFPHAVATKLPRQGVPWVVIVEDSRVQPASLQLVDRSALTGTLT